MAIPVTLLYGGLNALLVALLGANVSRVRTQFKVFVHETTPPDMLRFIRAHGNAAEWVPLGIVLMLMLELSGANTTLLHVYGGIFVLGRVIHAIGMIQKSGITAIGATLNYLVMLAMSGTAIYQHFQ